MFIFTLSKYNDVVFQEQVSQALKKRIELVSRKKYPKIWKFTDRMNPQKKLSEKMLNKRRRLYRIYGIFLLLLGFFLLIPSLMDPKELQTALITGITAVGIGSGYLMYGRGSKKAKPTSFDKAAMKLFQEYDNLPKCQVIFTNEAIQLHEQAAIDYREIEHFFITGDLFILIWNERITVLQKKDLTSNKEAEFIDFITCKSLHSFAVVNMI